MVEGDSRIDIDALSKWGQTYLMAQVGYQSTAKLSDREQLNFIRPFSGRDPYPRFHLRTTRSEGHFSVELHLDRREHHTTNSDEQIIVELERIGDFFTQFADKIHGTSPSYELFIGAFKRDLLFGVAERTPIPARLMHRDLLTAPRKGIRRKARSPRAYIPAPINLEEY